MLFKNVSRKHLLNGLISASTSDAIAAMKDEIITGKVDTELVNRLVASLGFISRYFKRLIEPYCFSVLCSFFPLDPL